MKIVFTTKLPLEGYETIREHELIMPENQKFTESELKALMLDCDILVSTFDYPISEAMIEAGKQLKYIANFGVGYNNVDIKAAEARNIPVTNTPLPVIEPTAEHAFTLMLGISHRVAELDRKMRLDNGSIKFGVMNNLGVAIYGKTLGIIGMGNIGQSLARRAKACGMKIIYHNRKQVSSDIESTLEARYVTMEELLMESDYVSLNMPYTPDTHHLINKDSFEKMKPTAILINTARGACVDESALVEALSEKTIWGAALDVYEFEPKITPELFELNNVLLSPHIGTGTIDGRIEMCKDVSENVIAFNERRYCDMNIVSKFSY